MYLVGGAEKKYALDSYLSIETRMSLEANATVVDYSKTLEHIAKSFVESGIYESADAFVSDLLKDVAVRKIRAYERKIKTYEAKYGSFEKFTRKIRGKASARQEDQWMDWEAAMNMVEAWKRVVCELGSSAS